MQIVMLAGMLMVMLSACATVKVEKGYNEVTKKKFCYLTSYPIASGWKKNASLYLENQDDNLRTLLQVEDISTLSVKSDFRHHPDLTFDIYKDDIKTDQVKLKTQTIDVKDWNEPIYYNGFIIGYARHSRVTSSVPLEKMALRKIMDAEAVSVTISDHNDSMDGNLSASKLELLKQFDKECFGSK